MGGHNDVLDAVRLENTGAVVSRTVTVNEPEDELPAASAAVTLTVVVPSANVEPDAAL